MMAYDGFIFSLAGKHKLFYIFMEKHLLHNPLYF